MIILLVYLFPVSALSTTVDGKADATHTHGNLQNDGKVGTSNNASKNVVTDANGKITTEAKPTIPSASSTTPSADTTNGSYGSGTSYARSNHTHPKSSLYAEATHYHNASDISYTSQSTVDDEIDDLWDVVTGLSSIKAINIVSTLPTATVSTMGKLYIISENSKVNVYYTEQTGTSPNYTYSWHKMDTDILDEFTVSWNDVQNKPTNILNSTINLVDKGETNEGCIVFNTIS